MEDKPRNAFVGLKRERERGWKALPRDAASVVPGDAVYGRAVPCVGEGGRVDASRKERHRSSERPVNSLSKKRDIRGGENPQGIPTKSRAHAKETRTD